MAPAVLRGGPDARSGVHPPRSHQLAAAGARHGLQAHAGRGQASTGTVHRILLPFYKAQGILLSILFCVITS